MGRKEKQMNEKQERKAGEQARSSDKGSTTEYVKYGIGYWLAD